MGKAIAYLAGVLILGMALSVLSGCDKSAAQAGPPQMPPPLVNIAQSRSQDVPVYLDEIGKCVARESVTVIPQIAGLITERHFEDGAELKKGQLLFTIDPRPFQAQLESAQAQLAQSKAALDFANIQLKRYADVADTRAISKSDYDTKKNAVDMAAAQVDATQAAVQTAKLNLEYCSIHSPVNGRAGARLVDAGNVVKDNTTQLLLIQRLDPIYAEFTVNERELAEVRRYMALGTLKTLAKLPTDSDPGREGDLIFLDNSVQDASGTVRLRALLPNADRHFWPGQFVNVRLTLRVHKDAVLVPSAAPQIGQKGPYLFVVGQDLSAEQRPVVIGQRQGDMVVIDQGLRAGEKVVVEGQMMVIPGGKVRLPPEQVAGGKL